MGDPPVGAANPISVRAGSAARVSACQSSSSRPTTRWPKHLRLAERAGPQHAVAAPRPAQSGVALQRPGDDLSWFRPHDLLPGGVEAVITADSSLTASIQRIAEESRLLTDPVAAHADLWSAGPRLGSLRVRLGAILHVYDHAAVALCVC